MIAIKGLNVRMIKNMYLDMYLLLCAFLLYKYDLKQGLAILLVIWYEDKKSKSKKVLIYFLYWSPTTLL